MARLPSGRKKTQKRPVAGASNPAAETKVSGDLLADSWPTEMVFNDAPVTSSRQKIALPSSGLAADILARADALNVTPTSDASLPALASEPQATAPTRAHNISFFAPVREERKAAEATEHLTTFLLAGEEYGVDVRLVQEIIRVSEITAVPRAREFIKGVINLRGRIIPLVDLKRRLGLGDVEQTRETRIVVVKIQERMIGLLVDGASQVLKIPLSRIEPAPEEVIEIDSNYIRGVAKLEGRLIILMDLHKILDELQKAQATTAVSVE